MHSAISMGCSMKYSSGSARFLWLITTTGRNSTRLLTADSRTSRVRQETIGTLAPYKLSDKRISFRNDGFMVEEKGPFIVASLGTPSLNSQLSSISGSSTTQNSSPRSLRHKKNSKSLLL